jgi:DNA-directed RNA polymerase subunit RPC12/RpoP
MMKAGAEQQIDLPCKNCGKTFAIFLRQMAAHNQKIVCPHCGQEHAYTGAGLTPAAPARQHPEKPRR